MREEGTWEESQQPSPIRSVAVFLRKRKRIFIDPPCSPPARAHESCYFRLSRFGERRLEADPDRIRFAARYILRRSVFHARRASTILMPPQRDCTPSLSTEQFGIAE